MSWEEFQSLTLPQLEALEYRREVDIRHGRFNAGLVVATMCRGEVSPFDVVPGFEKDPEEEARKQERRNIKRGIANRFVAMRGASRAECLAEKAKMIERMKENGVEDPEEIIREVFPDL